LAICTRPGTGICFKDHGWYPREVEDDLGTIDDIADERHLRKGRLYNKTLALVLKNLKANEDLRQQELTLKILNACPELVAG
jgi:nucleolar pre-ribosomal-associated protein 1